MRGPHARHVHLRRRDKEDRERAINEAEERELLKNMTEAERRAWEAAYPKVCHLSMTTLLHASLYQAFSP